MAMRLILISRRVNGKLMIRKSLNTISNVIAWMFGITFALGSITELFNGNTLFAITLLLGAVLLLPPIKNLIIKKIPKLDRWKLTLLGSVIIIFSFGFFAPETVSENTVLSKDDKQIVEEVDSDVGTAWGKPIVPVDKVDKVIPAPIIQKSQALSNQQNDKIENTDISEPEIKTNGSEVVKVAVEPKPEPVKLAEIPRNDDCSGLPRTCGAMANCAQAKKALVCGNGKLDRDNDGIPCESIC